MIEHKKGIFPILTVDEDHGLELLLFLARNYLDVRGLRRIKTMVGTDCRAVVVERHYIDKDYRDTFSHFHSKRFVTPPARCVRLHFFRAPVSQEQIKNNESSVQETYMGYCVVRPTKPNCIGRTFLSHRVRHDPESHLCLCEERIGLMGTPLWIKGFPFISQDSDVTVCAESSLWMLFRYFSNRYSRYAEILPFEITNLANNHASGNRVYPSSGLYSWQLAEALRLRDFSPVPYSRSQFSSGFDHLLYTYIESGFPVMITLPEHAVVGLGHASDFSRTFEATVDGLNACYTSRFNSTYVVNDDNCYPYQLLHAAGPQPERDSRYYWGDIEEFIVPLPERVFLTAGQVQTAIEKLLKDEEVGIHELSPSLDAKELILRLFLTTGMSFKRKLRTRGMGNPLVEESYRSIPMPHFVWVCEIAEYTEYVGDFQVRGEVLWDATRNAHETDGWIALHYPEILILDKGSAMNESQSLQELPLPHSAPYELYRSNLHTI